MNPFFLLTLAVAVSMLIIPLAWRLAPHLGMVDMPDVRKVHTAPVPRVGGWGIAIGTLIPLVLSFKLDPMLQSFAIASVTLFLFGLWDDARQIGHWAKFTGQLLAAGVVVYHGGLYISHFPFIDDPALGAAIGQPFTLFALVGTINAVNHSDGLDGLAGGESMLSLIAIAFLGYLVDNALVVGIALATMGGILGFLRYNTHPAQVFMGDSGSQVLGFTLGFLAVYLTQVAHPALSPALPLLLLGLPLADIVAVLFQRIRGGMNWFRATRNHVHHRLLDLGLDHYETVVVIYSIQAALVASAVLLRYQSDYSVAGLYCLSIGGLFTTLVVAESRGWKRRKREGGRSQLAAALARLQGNKQLRAAPLALISVLVPATMLFGATWAGKVPWDFGAVAALLAVALGVAIARNRAAGSVAVRTVVYVTAVFCVYLTLHYPRAACEPDGVIAGLPVETLMAAAMAAIAVAVFIRFAADRKFGTTPTDYLIVFGMLALAAFSNVDSKVHATVRFVMYATILLYGCEVLIERFERRRHPLLWSALAALLVMAVRGLLAAG